MRTTAKAITDALHAEFVLYHRAGMRTADREYIAHFVRSNFGANVVAGRPIDPVPICLIDAMRCAVNARTKREADDILTDALAQAQAHALTT